MTAVEAELAELKSACKNLLAACVIKTKTHLSFGPERYISRINELINREDHGAALETAEHLRQTLHRISAYPRLTADEMAKMALDALVFRPPSSR